MNRGETLNYIISMVEELTTMAREHHAPMLAFLLGMAVEEGREMVERDRMVEEQEASAAGG